MILLELRRKDEDDKRWRCKIADVLDSILKNQQKFYTRQEKTDAKVDVSQGSLQSIIESQLTFIMMLKKFVFRLEMFYFC